MISMISIMKSFKSLNNIKQIEGTYIKNNREIN